MAGKRIAEGVKRTVTLTPLAWRLIERRAERAGLPTASMWIELQARDGVDDNGAPILTAEEARAATSKKGTADQP